MSVQKTKLMVVGYGIEENDTLPLTLDNSCIEFVTEFPYLGSLVAENNRSHV